MFNTIRYKTETYSMQCEKYTVQYTWTLCPNAMKTKWLKCMNQYMYIIQMAETPNTTISVVIVCA